jgi:Cof subfamily protein (haloacid dehalogenase superfamily)
MYSIVVSDLDGTLLDAEHRISPFTRDTLQALAKRGIKFVLASGRHHIDVDKIRALLGLDIFLITSNGARIHDPRGDVVFRQDLPERMVDTLLQLPVDKDIHVNLYQEDRWLANRERPELRQYHRDSGFFYQVCDLRTASRETTCKLFFGGSPPQLLRLAAILEERFASQLSITFASPESLEVMDFGVSKARALAHVIDLKGYTLQDCIAFGDGMNDVEMLRSVGCGVVMENAATELRRALPGFEQARPNRDNGVAHYLRRLYGL